MAAGEVEESRVITILGFIKHVFDRALAVMIRMIIGVGVR